MDDAKKKKAMSILVAFGKGKPQEDEDPEASDEGGDDEGLIAAMGELRAALKSGDDRAAAEAFRYAMDLC